MSANPFSSYLTPTSLSPFPSIRPLPAPTSHSTTLTFHPLPVSSLSETTPSSLPCLAQQRALRESRDTHRSTRPRQCPPLTDPLGRQPSTPKRGGLISQSIHTIGWTDLPLRPQLSHRSVPNEPSLSLRLRPLDPFKFTTLPFNLSSNTPLAPNASPPMHGPACL